MNISTRPLLLLAILVSIAFFLLGFRLGKRIERMDKSFIPPTTIPSKTPPSKTPTPNAIGFDTFTHKGCGITFMYPTSLVLKKQSSQSAFFSGSDQTIVTNCTPDTIVKFTNKTKNTTPSATFKNNFGIIKLFNEKNLQSYIIKHTNKSTSTLITSDTKLTDLILKTINLVQ